MRHLTDAVQPVSVTVPGWELGAVATIPPKTSRTVQRVCGYAACKERHLVECFIGKLERFRRVFSRYDKYAHRYLAFVHLTSTIIWLS
jgi:transposase